MPSSRAARCIKHPSGEYPGRSQSRFHPPGARPILALTEGMKMETVTPEKQAEYDREFRDAFGDLEPLIRSMIQGADAVFTIAEGMATDGDDTHSNAVFFVGE